MKRSLIFFFFIQTLSLQSYAQDSVRVIFCVYSGMDCFGFPTMDKTIEHLDSLGRVTEVNIFHIEGCAGATADSDFIPVSDMFYVYDSASNVVEQTTFHYYGQDTTQYIESYTFDTWNYLTLHTTTIISQWQNGLTYSDSIIYNLNHDKIYELSLGWNYDISQMDTLRYETWIYDIAGKDSIATSFSYSNFILYSTTYEYFYYDSASRLTDINVRNNQDSTHINYGYDSLGYMTQQTHQYWDADSVAWTNEWREQYGYDSLHLKVSERLERWDTLSSAWFSDWLDIYQYDSLDRLIFIYKFNCSDSTCSDTLRRMIYTYDAAGHQITERSEEYDGNNTWFGTSGSHTYYTSFNDTSETGYGYYVEAGCSVSDITYYGYNYDQQLVHTQNSHFVCSENIIDCYYYNLNSDSLLVLLSFPATVCPFDTIHIPGIIAGGVPPYSYQWSPMTNVLDSNSASPRIVTDTTITYTLTVTDSLGHTNSSSVTVSVFRATIQPVSVTPIGVPCIGVPYYLAFNSDSLTGAWDYQWYMNGSPIFNDPETLQVFLNGTYSVTISNNDCAVSSNAIEVTLHQADTIHVTPSGITNLCAGESILLVSDSFPQVTWNTGDSSYSILADTTGNYFAFSVDSNGCRDTSDIVSVVVHDLPAIELGQDTSICDHDTLMLDPGNGFANYIWNDGTVLSTLDVTSAGIYSVEVIDSFGCAAVDTIQVSIHPLPIVSLGADTSICDDTTLQLDPGGGFASYLWNDGTLLSTLVVMSSGNYSVTVTDSSGCEASDTVQVIVNPLPFVSLGPDTTICNDATIQLDAGAGFNSYLWNDSSTNAFLTAFTTSMGVDTIEYFVLVSDSNNCMNGDTVQIIFEICAGVGEGEILQQVILYPNPANTSFEILLPEKLQQGRVEIYSAIGKRIFEIANSTEKIIVDCSLFSPGLYFVIVQNDMRTTLQRLIVTSKN